MSIYFLRRFSLLRSSRSSPPPPPPRFDDELEDGFAEGAEPLVPPCRISLKKSVKPNGSSSRWNCTGPSRGAARSAPLKPRSCSNLKIKSIIPQL